MTAADLTPAPAIPVVLAAGSVLALNPPRGGTLAGPGRCFEGHRLRRPGPGTLNLPGPDPMAEWDNRATPSVPAGESGGTA